MQWSLLNVYLFFTYAVHPAYQAHLAAYQARFYIEPEASENAEAQCTRTTNGSSIQLLPALKERVKNVIFYC